MNWVLVDGTIQRPARLTTDLAAGDADLVAAAREGDTGAFAELFRRHHPRVLRLCRARLRGDFHAAEDVAMDTFARLIASLDTIREPAKVGRWLRAAARRACLDHLKSARVRLNVPLGNQDAACGVDTEAAVSEKVMVEGLLGAVGDGERVVLVEHHLRGDPLADVEARHGWAPGSGKVRASRGRAKARRFGEARGYRRWLAWLPWWRWPRRTNPAAAPAAAESLTIAAGALLAPLLAAGLAVGLGLVASRVPPDRVDGVEEPSRPWTEPAEIPSPAPLSPSGWAASTNTGREHAPAASASSSPYVPPPALVAFDPVPVPVIDRQVRSDPPREGPPRYRVEIDTGLRVGDTPVSVFVANYDDPAEADPAYEAACDAAYGTPPPLTCTHDERATPPTGGEEG